MVNNKKEDAAACCILWTTIICGLISAFAFFGKLIYGGVYWGSLKYWNDYRAPEWMSHLYLVSLLQWIFTLVLPIGDFVCLCMLVHSTASERCGDHMPKNDDIWQLIKVRYFTDLEGGTEKYWYDRCKLPNTMFITFLVCYLVGGPLTLIPRCCGAICCIGMAEAGSSSSF